MNKEFVPYKQALALKELGFDEPCLAFYISKTKFALVDENDSVSNSILEEESHNDALKALEIDTGDQLEDFFKIEDRLNLTAPLYQQAFRWFREKYKFVGTILGDGFNGELKGYYYSITEEGWINYYESIDSRVWYDTYEKAELACLKKLIEIVKP